MRIRRRLPKQWRRDTNGRVVFGVIDDLVGRRLHLVQEGSVTDGQVALTVEALPGETLGEVLKLGVLDRGSAQALMLALHLFVSSCENPDALRQCNEPRRGRGYRLKELRERKRVTQVQLAGHVACSPQTIAFIETGRRHHVRMDLLRRMASFFEMTIEELEMYLGMLPRTSEGGDTERHEEGDRDTVGGVEDEDAANGLRDTFLGEGGGRKGRRKWRGTDHLKKGGVVHKRDRKSVKIGQKEPKKGKKGAILPEIDVFGQIEGMEPFLPPALRILDMDVKAKKNSE